MSENISSNDTKNEEGEAMEICQNNEKEDLENDQAQNTEEIEARAEKENDVMIIENIENRKKKESLLKENDQIDFIPFGDNDEEYSEDSKSVVDLSEEQEAASGKEIDNNESIITIQDSKSVVDLSEEQEVAPDKKIDNNESVITIQDDTDNDITMHTDDEDHDYGGDNYGDGDDGDDSDDSDDGDDGGDDTINVTASTISTEESDKKDKLNNDKNELEEILKSKIKLSDNTECEIFSVGLCESYIRPDGTIKYSDSRLPINCHLCRVTIGNDKSFKFHINTEKHKKELDKSPNAVEYRKPFTQALKQKDVLFPIKIYPGETIKRITPEYYDRVLPIQDLPFGIPVSKALVDLLKDDLIHEYNKTAPLIGLCYLYKMTDKENILYYCVLCHTMQKSALSMYMHLTSSNHQFAYWSKHFHNFLVKLELLEDDPGQKNLRFFRRIFRYLYRKIELVCGFRKITVIDYEKFQKDQGKFIHAATYPTFKYHYNENTIQFEENEFETLYQKCNNHEFIIEDDPQKLPGFEEKKHLIKSKLKRAIDSGMLLDESLIFPQSEFITVNSIEELQAMYKQYELDPPSHPAYERKLHRFRQRFGSKAKKESNPDYNFDTAWKEKWIDFLTQLYNRHEAYILNLQSNASQVNENQTKLTNTSQVNKNQAKITSPQSNASQTNKNQPKITNASDKNENKNKITNPQSNASKKNLNNTKRIINSQMNISRKRTLQMEQEQDIPMPPRKLMYNPYASVLHQSNLLTQTIPISMEYQQLQQQQQIFDKLESIKSDIFLTKQQTEFQLNKFFHPSKTFQQHQQRSSNPFPKPQQSQRSFGISTKFQQQQQQERPINSMKKPHQLEQTFNHPSKSQQQGRTFNPPSRAQQQQHRSFTRFQQEENSPATVISVLRLLTAFEDQLGSFTPKAVEYLGEAYICEQEEDESSNKLLEDRKFYMFFVTVMEKLKGLLMANIVPQDKIPPVQNVISDIEELIKRQGKIKHQDRPAIREESIDNNLEIKSKPPPPPPFFKSISRSETKRSTDRHSYDPKRRSDHHDDYIHKYSNEHSSSSSPSSPAERNRFSIPQSPNAVIEDWRRRRNLSKDNSSSRHDRTSTMTSNNDEPLRYFQAMQRDEDNRDNTRDSYNRSTDRSHFWK